MYLNILTHLKRKCFLKWDQARGCALQVWSWTEFFEYFISQICRPMGELHPSGDRTVVWGKLWFHFGIFTLTGNLVSTGYQALLIPTQIHSHEAVFLLLPQGCGTCSHYSLFTHKFEKIRAVNFPGKLGDVYLRLGFRSNWLKRCSGTYVWWVQLYFFYFSLQLVRWPFWSLLQFPGCLFAKLGGS